jgi:hypothetical protein
MVAKTCLVYDDAYSVTVVVDELHRTVGVPAHDVTINT